MDVDFRLYLVTDRTQTGGRPLLPLIEQALRAGLKAVQLREKDLSTRRLLALGREVLACTRAYGARLLINDRIDVALALGADGVHLRSDSVPIPVARRLLGVDRLLGVSTHSVKDVMEASAAGADFVVLGPVFDTPSKRAYGAPLGLVPLAESASHCSIPIFAIGGLNASRVREVSEAGAFGIAVVSSILGAPDVEAATRALQEALHCR